MSTTTDQNVDQVRRAREGRKDDRLVLACEDDLCEEAQLVLAADPDPQVAMTLADNSPLTVAAQLLLAQHESTRVRAHLPTAVQLDPQAQRQMARDQDAEVCWILAASQKLPVDVQELLLAREPKAREGLARSRYLEASVLERLSVDESAKVRMQAAERAELSPEARARLCRDDSELVRMVMACSMWLSPDLHLVLAGDASDRVRRVLATNGTVVLTDDMPVIFYESEEELQEVLESRLAGTDPAARAALAPEFAGTLRELLAALDSFK